MSTQTEMTILLKLRDQATAGFGKASKGVAKYKDQLRTAGKTATIAGAAITGIFALAIKSSQEQQIGINRLDQSLKNVNTTYAAQKDQIEALIASQQRKTNFGDEAQRDALQKLVTIGGKWEGTLDALKVTTDVAAGANIDLNAAALLVGKAIAGETSSLSRYGILLEKGATQTEIMAALTRQFGGAAEAAADPFTQLKNRMGDMLQVLGDALLPIVAMAAQKMEEITRRITDWTAENPKLTKIIALSVAGLGALLLVLGPLLILLPAIAAGVGLVSAASLPLTIIPLAIGVAIAALIVIFVKWDKMSKKLKIVLLAVGTVLTGGLLPAALLIAKNWGTIWPAMQRATEAAVNGIISGINFAMGKIADFVAGTKTLLDIAPGGNPFGDAMQAAVDNLRRGIDSVELFTRTVKLSAEEMDIWGSTVVDASEKAATAQEVVAKSNEEFEDRRIELMRLSRDASSTAFRDELDEFVRLNQGKAQAAQDAANRIMSAFNSQTDSLLFNFSDQGAAWNKLGGNAEAVIRALSTQSGVAADEIVLAFQKMRLEGETWKDALLRFSGEGIFSMVALAKATDKVTEAITRAQSSSGVSLGNRLELNTLQNSLGLLGVQRSEAVRTGQASGPGFQDLLQRIADIQQRIAVIGGGNVPATIAPNTPGNFVPRLTINVPVAGSVFGTDLEDIVASALSEGARRSGFVFEGI